MIRKILSIGVIVLTLCSLAFYFINAESGTFGATVLFPSGGGTGTSTKPLLNQILLGNSNGRYDLVDKSEVGKYSRYLVEIPSTFPDTGIDYYRSASGTYTSSFNPDTYTNTWSIGGNIYVDPVNGNDGTGDGSVGNPYKNLNKAMTIAVASSSLSVQITFITGGADVYLNRDQFTYPALNIVGKKIYITTDNNSYKIYASNQQAGLTWALTSGQTYTYEATRSGVAGVIDLSDGYDANGLPTTHYLKKYSIADVEATAGSYFASTTKVYVHTRAGTTPVYGTHLINVQTELFKVRLASSSELYLRNIYFIGQRTVDIGNITAPLDTSDTKVTLYNTGFAHATTSNGISFTNVKKVQVFNSYAGYNFADGFNTHYASVTSNIRDYWSSYFQCESYWNGADSGLSNNNAFTSHEGANVILIDSIGHDTYGPIIAHAGGCNVFVEGCQAYNSHHLDPDARANAGYWSDNNSANLASSTMYIYNSSADNSAWDLSSDGTVPIILRNFNGTRIPDETYANVTYLPSDQSSDDFSKDLASYGINVNYTTDNVGINMLPSLTDEFSVNGTLTTYASGSVLMRAGTFDVVNVISSAIPNEVAGHPSLAPMNGANISTPGKIGQALSLDGASQYAKATGGFLPQGSSARTVTAWINSTDNQGNYGGIIGWGQGDCLGGQYGIGIQSGIYVWGACNDFDSGLTPTPGTWQFLAVVYNDVAGTSTVYLDTNTFTGTPAPYHNGASDLFMGMTTIDNGASAVNFYKGLLDEVAIYDRALSADEIATIKNDGDIGNANSVTSGMQYYYRMDSDSPSYSTTTVKSVYINGLVGINQEIPTAKLDIYSTTTGEALLNIGSNIMANTLYVNSDGRIGINTNAPDNMVNIVGNTVHLSGTELSMTGGGNLDLTDGHFGITNGNINTTNGGIYVNIPYYQPATFFNTSESYQGYTEFLAGVFAGYSGSLAFGTYSDYADASNNFGYVRFWGNDFGGGFYTQDNKVFFGADLNASGHSKQLLSMMNVDGDLETMHPGMGFISHSPDDSRLRVTVENTGNLKIENLTTPGTSYTLNTLADGLAGQIPYFATDGKFLTATSSIFLSPDGMFGVGTTAPTKILTVAGDGYFGSNVITTNTAPNLTIEKTKAGQNSILTLRNPRALANDTADIDFSITSSAILARFGAIRTNVGVSGANDFHWDLYNGSLGERMRLTASGNLGIGTNTPSYPLDLGTTGYGRMKDLYLVDLPNGGTTITSSSTALSILQLDRAISTIIYKPATTTTITGTYVSGATSSIEFPNDGLTYHVDEVTGVPGFNIQTDFYNVATSTVINTLKTRFWYNGSATHNVDLQIYNYATPGWNTLQTVQGTPSYVSLNLELTNGNNYVSATGTVNVRFYHTTTGNASHDIQIDYLSIQKGISGGGGITQHNLLSGLNWSSAGHTFDTDLNINGYGLVSTGTSTLATTTITGSFSIGAIASRIMEVLSSVMNSYVNVKIVGTNKCLNFGNDSTGNGTSTPGICWDGKRINLGYSTLNNATTTVMSLQEPASIAGTATAAHYMTFTDDFSRFLVCGSASGGTCFLRNSTYAGSNNVYGVPSASTTAQAFTVSTVYGAAGTIKGAVTYEGYHYVLASTTVAGFLGVKRATSSWDNNIAVIGGWATSTISGRAIGNADFIVGVSEDTLWVATSTTQLAKYTIATSTNTLTYAGGVTISASAMTINNTRVNYTGIYAGFGAAPYIRKHNLSGGVLNISRLVASPATTPDLLTTPTSFYAIGDGPTTMVSRIQGF